MYALCRKLIYVAVSDAMSKDLISAVAVRANAMTRTNNEAGYFRSDAVDFPFKENCKFLFK